MMAMTTSNSISVKPVRRRMVLSPCRGRSGKVVMKPKRTPICLSWGDYRWFTLISRMDRCQKKSLGRFRVGPETGHLQFRVAQLLYKSTVRLPHPARTRNSCRHGLEVKGYRLVMMYVGCRNVQNGGGLPGIFLVLAPEDVPRMSDVVREEIERYMKRPGCFPERFPERD